MAVRFILGRAGSGKTHHCLKAIRDRLKQNPVDGPRLLFLVPEQASQQMERSLLLPLGGEEAIAASHRAEVLSFQRLAERLLESSSAQDRTLSEAGRVMVLRHLARQLTPRLKYYRRVQHHSGFLERLAGTISEFIQEGVTAESLNVVHEPGDAEANMAGREKFQDLAILYDSYLRFLGQDLVDPSQRLSLARAGLPNCDWIHGCELWVDGFASLSSEETATLCELARYARQTEIAVLIDCAAAGPQTLPTREVFTRTAKTYGRLQSSLAQAGLNIEEPLILKPALLPRFKDNQDLGTLEENLFGRPLHAPTGQMNLFGPGTLSLIEAPSRRIEVEYAVSLICQWTRCDPPKYRYRDIAIIVRDLEPYYDPIRCALEDRSIPCFIDRRRPVAHHPLIQLLTTGARMAVEGLTLDLMRAILKTGLLSLAPELKDELENYLIAHGIQGVQAWSGKDWSHRRIGSRNKSVSRSTYEAEQLARVNHARRLVWCELEGWIAFCSSPPNHSGIEWAQGLRAWLAELGVEEKLSAWMREADARGDLDQASEHEQVWLDIEAFLGSLEVAFGERQLEKDEFAQVLDAGLASLTLGLVPPNVDQVLVGSIERTRHPDVKAAIVLGFNDGVFPARVTEDSVLNDDDRSRLLQSGVEVGLSARTRIRDELMLVYIALTRASHELVVTYARSDDQGRALHPSPYARDVMEACPSLRHQIVHDPYSVGSLWDIQCLGDLRRRLVSCFGCDGESAGASKFPDQWKLLYNHALADLQTDRLSRQVFADLGGMKQARLSAHSVRKLFPDALQVSVSSMEAHASCPFKFFAQRVLNLKERTQAQLAPVDVGSIHHAILEEFARDLVSQETALSGLSAEQIHDRLAASCQRAAAAFDAGPDTARDSYRMRRAAQRLARVLRAQKKAIGDKLRTQAAELAFGADDGTGLPPLQLQTPSGRMVLLRGFIDRVDIAELADELLGIVVDYKNTRKKNLEFSESYHGLSLQLVAYLLVLAEHGVTLAGRPIQPAGAFYLSLSPQYHRVPHPDCEPNREGTQEGTHPPRGLLDASAIDKLNVEICTDGRAAQLNIYRKKDGRLARLDSNDAAAPESFRAMLAHTKRRMGELADEIFDGRIEVRPYRLGSFSPCSWCAMPMSCRFESTACDVRYLDNLKRSEIYRRLASDSSASSFRQEA